MQANNKVVKIKSKKSFDPNQPGDHKKINKRDRKIKRDLKRNFDHE